MAKEPISVDSGSLSLTEVGFPFPGGLRLRFLAGRLAGLETFFLNALFLRKSHSFSLRFRKLRNLLCKIQTVGVAAHRVAAFLKRDPTSAAFACAVGTRSGVGLA